MKIQKFPITSGQPEWEHKTDCCVITLSNGTEIQIEEAYPGDVLIVRTVAGAMLVQPGAANSVYVAATASFSTTLVQLGEDGVV